MFYDAGGRVGVNKNSYIYAWEVQFVWVNVLDWIYNLEIDNYTFQ